MWDGTAPLPPHVHGVALGTIEWRAHRALGDAEWHADRHMRSCWKILCHSMTASGTFIVHSVVPSGAVWAIAARSGRWTSDQRYDRDGSYRHARQSDVRTSRPVTRTGYGGGRLRAGLR